MEPKIHLIRERATQQQMDEMQRALGDRIKLAVASKSQDKRVSGVSAFLSCRVC